MESNEQVDETLVKSRRIHFIQVAFTISIIFSFSFLYFQRSQLLTARHPVFKDVLSFTNTSFKRNNSSNLILLQNPEIRCVVYTQGNFGRLGNALFIVASAYGLARLHSCHLYIPPSKVDVLKKTFVLNLSPLLIESMQFSRFSQKAIKLTRNISLSVECAFTVELTRPNAIGYGFLFELRGYWLSYLHFVKYSDDLQQKILVAKQSIFQKVAKIFTEICKLRFNISVPFALKNHQSFKRQLVELNRTTWIGIHIRRSDFVVLGYASSHEYLFKAIAHYTSIYSSTQFIVASDDKPYCEQIFRHRQNIYITPDSFSEGEDLITLSLCQHSIITGGTFGWWSGFLANGQVYHDTVYPSGCHRREYYYPPWFFIDGKLRIDKNSEYTL